MANAIVMASGLGTRMRPLTASTPKPLLKVHGKSMAESVIEALIAKGVEHVYVVVGYYKEQFSYLTKKYACVTLVENPDYRTVNNVSSVYYARAALRQGDTYVCEADLYVSNGRLLDKGLAQSCYFGKFVAGYSGDWVFDTDDRGVITRVGKGGTDRYNMVGVAYFTAADATVLADKIEQAYGAKGYENLFWDDVVNANIANFQLRVAPVAENDIYEIDTPEELARINAL